MIQVEAALVGQAIDYGECIFPKKPLPPEVALRVIPGIDANDPVALLNLINLYGPLTPRLRDADVELLPWFARTHLENWIQEDLNVESAPVSGAVRIEVARYHVRVLQSLVSHWDAHQRRDEDEVVRAWSWLIADLAEWRDDIDSSIGSAWDLWTTHMNGALGPVTAYLSVLDPQGNERGWKKDLGATAYSAMVIEIFNDVVTSTSWHRCARENCGTLFARQQGRAQAGQHRTTGVIYCSAACSNAQGQTNLRRRRRAADRKREETNGR